MNFEQLDAAVSAQGRQLVALEESTKSAHKRINEMTALCDSNRELAKNVAVLAVEVKHAVQQGERNEAKIIQLAEELKELRLEPANRWKCLVTQLVGLLLAAGMGALFASYYF